MTQFFQPIIYKGKNGDFLKKLKKNINQMFSMDLVLILMTKL